MTVRSLLGVLGAMLLLAVDAVAATAPEVQRIVVEEALNSRVPPSLALAVARVESNFRDNAESHAGARGVMQIMPATARGEYGVHPDELWDARLNVQLGIDFLQRLIERYGGRWDAALSHYNGGSLRGSGRHVAPHAFTRDYVATVLGWEKRYAAQSALWLADMPLPPTFTAARTRPDSVAKSPEPPVPASRWPLSVPSLARGLDDFDHGMDRRRLRQRGRLDDFAPQVRWRQG